MISERRPADFTPDFEIAICLFAHDGRMLLLRRQDWETAPNKWCCPGGGVHEGETALQTIMREAKEETGIDAPEGDYKFCGTVYVENDGGKFVSHVFRCNLEKRPEVRTNQQEHKDFRWVTPEEAQQLDLVGDGEMTIKKFFKPRVAEGRERSKI